MLTWKQASEQSRSELLAAVMKSTFSTDKLFEAMSWAQSSGKTHSYLRERALPTAGFIAPGGAITPTATTLKPVSTTLQTIACSAQIPGSANRNLNNLLSQYEVQLNGLGRSFSRLLRQSLFTGDYPTVAFTLAGVLLDSAGPYLQPGVGSIRQVNGAGTIKLQFRAPGDTDYGDLSIDVDAGNPTVTLTSADGTQYITVDVTSGGLGVASVVVDCTVSSTTYAFDGFARTVTNTVTGPTGTGDDISFDLLRYLIDAVDPSAGNVVLVANPRTVRNIRTLLDAKVTDPVKLCDPRYGITGPVLQFDGYPILPNEYIALTESKGGGAATYSSVYALALAPSGNGVSTALEKAAGVVGLHGSGSGFQAEDVTTMGVTVIVDREPRDGDGKLLDAVEIAMVGDYSVAVYSEKACGRLYAIT